MDKKLFCRLDKPYEAPTTIVFAIHSEGVLCGSFDDNHFTENFDRNPNDEIEDL